MPKTKSSAVSGTPSDQFASRRWKVQVRPSGLVSHEVASAGMTLPSGLSCVRPTINWPTMTFSQTPSILAGSSVAGSAPLP